MCPVFSRVLEGHLHSRKKNQLEGHPAGLQMEDPTATPSVTRSVIYVYTAEKEEKEENHPFEIDPLFSSRPVFVGEILRALGCDSKARRKRGGISSSSEPVPTFLLRVSLEGSSTGRGFSRRVEQARRPLPQSWIQRCHPCAGYRHRPVPLSFLVV